MATARELNQISQLQNLGSYMKLTQKKTSCQPTMQGKRDPATGKEFSVFSNGGSGQVINLSNAGGVPYGATLPSATNCGGSVYTESKNK
jgi:hypothetical protein